MVPLYFNAFFEPVVTFFLHQFGRVKNPSLSYAEQDLEGVLDVVSL